MLRYINLDMDGVLADFRTHYQETFGEDDAVVGSKRVCEQLATRPDFFENCPILPGAQEFFYHACTRQHTSAVILTSCPVSSFEASARAKRNWIRKHFGGIPVIPVPGSRNKHLYLQQAGDILIDDWGKNCEDWCSDGGIAIKHEDWERTTQQFNVWLSSLRRSA